MAQDRLRQMQRQMEESQRQQAPSRETKNNSKEGDYIDYEEVK